MGTASPDLSALAQPGVPAQGAAPAAPTPSAPPAVDPNQPHAKLIHMIQGLAEGVGAFATSAATGGRQGGVQEVAQFRAQQQQQRIQQQEADQQAKETGLRMQAMNASMQIQQAQFEHNKQMWPIEQKTAQITASDAASKALQDDLQTASGFGLDITDPAQKARYEQMKNEYSPAQQSAAAQAVQGSIKIPFTSGQNQDAVMQGVQAAIPNGKHLVDYQVVVEGGHGKDGQVTLIPNDALKQLQATPRQVNATTAEVNNALDAAKASGLQDDPQIKALQAQWQNVQNEIQKGGKLSVSDLNSLKFSVLGPVSSRIAGAANASKIQKEKQEADPLFKLENDPGAMEGGKASSAVALLQNKLSAETDPAQKARESRLLAQAQSAHARFIQDTQSKALAEQSARQGDPNAAGQLLADGSLTLTDLKSRGTTPSFVVAATKAAQKIDPKYNPADEINAEQVAKSPMQNQFFGSANSLIAKGGTLDQLQAIAKTIPAHDFPALNSIDDWQKLARGKGALAGYAATALGVADDFGKVMGGGAASDHARDSALQIISAAASPEMRQSAIDGIRGSVQSQRDSRIGKNKFLKRMYAPDDDASGGLSPAAQALIQKYSGAQ